MEIGIVGYSYNLSNQEAEAGSYKSVDSLGYNIRPYLTKLKKNRGREKAAG